MHSNLSRWWFRVRWACARRIAPKGCYVLYAKGQGLRHDCVLLSSPVHEWGTAYRHVPEGVADVFCS